MGRDLVLHVRLQASMIPVGVRIDGIGASLQGL